MRWCYGIPFMFVLGVAVEEPQPWWKSAVLYQIYPRSFKDSDGDGVGDLKGITEMVGYFKELGVDAVWLSPIYKSPMVDFGYDISNFTEIDPLFGDMTDFETLLATFKDAAIRVLLDFVPNHTSDEHEWFQKSVKNDSDYRDFFVWLDPKFDSNRTRIPPNNWLSIFSGSAWEWSEDRGQYYYHQFAVKQPDLNYRNPAVLGNMTEVMNFWLDKGVDGFRMDAVQHLFEDSRFLDEPVIPGIPQGRYMSLKHIYTKDQNESFIMVHDWAKVMYDRDQRDAKDRIIVLEVGGPTKLVTLYYGTGTENLEFPFNFNLMQRVNQSSRAPDIKYQIDDWITNMPQDGQATWVVGNHDTVRVADTCGPEMVDSINILTIVLPGIRVAYSGEEIGMQDTFIRWDQTVDPAGKNLGPDHYLERTRDPVRTPMQWDDSISSGFSKSQKTWLPVNPNYWWLNVHAQRTAATSHLKVFKAMVKAKKDPVLQFGGANVMTPDNDTLVVVRNYSASYFVLVMNVGSNVRTYTSQNLFVPYGLDMNMFVAVSSMNCGYSPGLFLQQGSLSVTLRPKGAVLLTTNTWATTTASPSTTVTIQSTAHTSSASRDYCLNAFSILLACSTLLRLLNPTL